MTHVDPTNPRASWAHLSAAPLIDQLLADYHAHTLPPDPRDAQPMDDDTYRLMVATAGYNCTLLAAFNYGMGAGEMNTGYRGPGWWGFAMLALAAWPSAWTMLTPHPDPDLPPAAVRAMAPAIAAGYTLRGA